MAAQKHKTHWPEEKYNPLLITRFLGNLNLEWNLVPLKYRVNKRYVWWRFYTWMLGNICSHCSKTNGISRMEKVDLPLALIHLHAGQKSVSSPCVSEFSLVWVSKSGRPDSMQNSWKTALYFRLTSVTTLKLVSLFFNVVAARRNMAEAELLTLVMYPWPGHRASLGSSKTHSYGCP